MLRPDDKPHDWLRVCHKNFGQPMGAPEGARSLMAECVSFDNDIVEFKNSVNDFHFDIETKLFSLIPHVGAIVYIDPVHFAVFYNRPQMGARIDLIVGRPR